MRGLFVNRSNTAHHTCAREISGLVGHEISLRMRDSHNSVAWIIIIIGRYQNGDTRRLIDDSSIRCLVSDERSSAKPKRFNRVAQSNFRHRSKLVNYHTEHDLIIKKKCLSMPTVMLTKKIIILNNTILFMSIYLHFTRCCIIINDFVPVI